MHIKREIRILAIDDSPLIDESVTVIGTFFRAGEQLDGVLLDKITKDSFDATDVFIRMIKRSKFYVQTRVIMLDGVTYGGFNPVDINVLFEETGLPVVVFMRSCPDFEKIRLAIAHLPDMEKRNEIIKRAGIIHKLEKENPVFFQVCGIDKESASSIIQMASTHGNIPEPLRVAHLIATGVVLGESAGRA